MKFGRLFLSLFLVASLWHAALGAAANHSFTAQTVPASTTPADTTDAAEMIPRPSHWPAVVLSASLGLFVMAAIIGPVVAAQARDKDALVGSKGDHPPRAGRTKAR